jgi:hypothetical protein
MNNARATGLQECGPSNDWILLANLFRHHKAEVSAEAASKYGAFKQAIHEATFQRF